MSSVIPPILGITGSIDFRSSSSTPGVAELTDKVHLLPCCIRQDGPCPVSQYFKPKETGVEVDGLKVKEAFFRGRRLQGATLNIPDGYSGFVLGKEDSQDKCMAEESYSSNCWSSKADFKNITYWNHDDVPSQDDPTLRCFHWVTIADVDLRTKTRIGLGHEGPDELYYLDGSLVASAFLSTSVTNFQGHFCYTSL